MIVFQIIATIMMRMTVQRVGMVVMVVVEVVMMM